MNQLAHDVCHAILVQLLDIVGIHVVNVLDLGIEAAAFRLRSAEGLSQVRIFLDEVKFVELPFLDLVVDCVHESGLLLGTLGPVSSVCARAEESLVVYMHGSHHLQPGGKVLVESVVPNSKSNFFQKSIFELLEAYHTNDDVMMIKVLIRF